MGATFVCYTQSSIKSLKDSIVIETFFGETNDVLYWNGKKYNCSYSPLNIFDGYNALYTPINTICFNTYENIIDDKNYAAIWIIIDDYLYLCDVRAVCDDEIYIEIENYCESFGKKFIIDDLFSIKMHRLERLIGRYLQKKFPVGIYKYPLGAGSVIAADWFNGNIKIKDQSSDYFAPYQQLEFKAGKAKSIQNMIYYEWDDMKKTIYNNSTPTFLRKPKE